MSENTFQADGIDLLSLDIKIGDALQLQDTTTDLARHYIKLIGFFKNNSLVVTLPESKDLPLDLFTGQAVLIRGFANRKLYEFQSYVLTVHNEPYPHLHLAYPKDVDVTQMRGALRIRLELPCAIQVVSRQLKSSATIGDLSTSGAKILAKQKFADLTDEIIVKFQLELDGQQYNYNIAAIIRNTQTETSNTGTTHISHGVEFINLEPAMSVILQNYICKRIVEGQKDKTEENS